MFCEYQKVNVNSSKEGSAKDQMFVEVKFEETVEELSADGRTDQLVSCVDVEDVDGSAAERDKTISLSNDYSCRDSTNARRLLEIEHCKTFYTTLGDSKSSVALQYASGLGSYEFAVDEIQTMHSETIGEVVKEDSIAIPSKVSSVHNLCFGNDGDIVSSVKSFVSKRKSSSLSCLPDRIYFLESPSFTLPPRLSSVKAFNPNLGEGRSDHTCYDTAESVSSSSEESSKEEDLVEKFDKVTTHDSYREDQESSGEHTKVN